MACAYSSGDAFSVMLPVRLRLTRFSAPLPTPVGTMKGKYTFVGEGGEQFDVPVPEFLLSMPRVLHYSLSGGVLGADDSSSGFSTG